MEADCGEPPDRADQRRPKQQPAIVAVVARSVRCRFRARRCFGDFGRVFHGLRMLSKICSLTETNSLRLRDCVEVSSETKLFAMAVASKMASASMRSKWARRRDPAWHIFDAFSQRVAR